MIGRQGALVEGLSDQAIAFTRLADDRLDGSYRLAHAILGSRAEAEDATHDALVQAWRHWPQLRDRSRFDQWFDRILVNECRSRLRRMKRWPTQDLSPDLAALGQDPIKNADDREVIRGALATLSPDHRVVVALRFYLDLPVDDIASRLGVPSGTVNSRLHYAMRRLRAAIGDTDRQGAPR